MTVHNRFAAMRTIFIAAGLLALLSLSAAAQLKLVPTTTYAAETANNTSTSSTFKAQTNGNAGPGNVSKSSIRNLLYPGSTTKIYAAVMPWFGLPWHISVGYNSSDPAKIADQVSDMLHRGIQGAIIPWYGPNKTIESAMAVNYMQEAQSRGNFEFAIMIDVGALTSYAQQNGCDVTTQVINHLTYIATTFYGSSAYTRVDGRPVVYLFGVEAYYIDWNKVRSSVPGNPMFMVRNQGAFSDSSADGAYTWVEINRSNPNDMMLSYLDSFYTAAQSSSKYTAGSAYKGFNDTLAQWGQNRIVNQQCARTWLATFAEINKYYSSLHQLAAAQIVTWNDYEEGTEIETGVDNCVSLTTTVNGSTLNWSIGPGNENAIDYYNVFISTDGQNLMNLAVVPAGVHSLSLSQYNLANQIYVLYVQAMGKASIVNHISFPVAFNPADQAPSASLSLNPSSGTVPLSVTASAASSSDPDGSIVSAKFDFGDGTVVSGSSLTATHTYVTPGKYTVMLTVTDNAGIFATTQGTVTVAAGPGVTITSPSPGATVNSPVHVAATGNMTLGVTSMDVLIDGAASPAFTTTGASVDTFLKMDIGTHTVRVVAHDTSGSSVYSDISFSVGGNDAPPTARLSVNPFGGNQVMACTATSYDSDGSISSTVVNFGDGATAGGPTAFHTYSSPGTYTVQATVTDNQGVSSSTSMQVTVGLNAPDFNFAFNSTTLSLTAGTSGNVGTVAITMLTRNGFTGTVNLTCTVASLPGTTCSLSPASLTSPGTATLTVTAPATHASLRPPRWPPRFFPWTDGSFAIAMGLVIVGKGHRSSKKKLRMLMVAVLLVTGLVLMAGCGGGGGGSSSSTSSSATTGTAQTGTVTVQGTSGNISHSFTIGVTVN